MYFPGFYWVFLENSEKFVGGNAKIPILKFNIFLENSVKFIIFSRLGICQAYNKHVKDKKQEIRDEHMEENGISKCSTGWDTPYHTFK